MRGWIETLPEIVSSGHSASLLLHFLCGQRLTVRHTCTLEEIDARLPSGEMNSDTAVLVASPHIAGPAGEARLWDEGKEARGVDGVEAHGVVDFQPPGSARVAKTRTEDDVFLSSA